MALAAAVLGEVLHTDAIFLRKRKGNAALHRLAGFMAYDDCLVCLVDYLAADPATEVRLRPESFFLPPLSIRLSPALVSFSQGWDSPHEH